MHWKMFASEAIKNKEKYTTNQTRGIVNFRIEICKEIIIVFLISLKKLF